eukprot:NODE_21810_length_735_cov_6.473684.p1 GENE.NODE_21810_length_735_cov_6.473684~~NODE_21810_length_735_cov_6.473684.p1  ORF type:complete len:210 (+),score=46.78 NODE_21810_length_735_cov_6.473684:51-632(+)
MAREALFRGENHLDMLRKIAGALGFNFDNDLAWLPPASVEASRGMMEKLQLPERPTRTLEEFVPSASEVCMDLVHRLLCWDPNHRISAAAAIEHPYLARLRDPPGETTAPEPFNWHFDDFEANPRTIKDRVYAECARLHPEIIERDADWLTRRGFLPPAITRDTAHTRLGTAPLGPSSAPSLPQMSPRLPRED